MNKNAYLDASRQLHDTSAKEQLAPGDELQDQKGDVGYAPVQRVSWTCASSFAPSHFTMDQQKKEGGLKPFPGPASSQASLLTS